MENIAQELSFSAIQKKREAKINAMKDKVFDVIVIGGGITGAGIAWDATLRGMSVALFEKNDFAYGTSSKSSKLIHGGLRYLEHKEFRLVHEACSERRTVRRIAPHLVHPLMFLIPIYKGEKPRKIELRLGLLLYDALASFRNVKRHKFVNAKKALELAPELRKEGLKGAGLYYDLQMDDARLCLENILSASQHGAETLSYAEVIALQHHPENHLYTVTVKDHIINTEFTVKGKIIVNATGPWLDNILHLKNPQEPQKIVLSKGIHLFVPRLSTENIAVTLPTEDKRIMFVLPWNEHYTLIGTTDTHYDKDPDHVFADSDDVDYLLRNLKKYYAIELSKKDILCTIAGVRALIYSPKKRTADISREDKIFVTKDGFISIGGGKYTTYRKMAKRVVDIIVKKFKPIPKPQKCRTAHTPLVGGNIPLDFDTWQQQQLPTLIEPPYNLDEDIAKHLTNTYGTRYTKILEIIKENPESKNRIVPNDYYIYAELILALKEEHMFTITDFVWRRTHLAYHGNGIDATKNIGDFLLKKLQWPQDLVNQQINETIELIKKSLDF